MYCNSCILLFLVLRYCDAQFTSFIASFQSLGYWSQNEYLEYKDSLPQMKEFTVCHWEKTQFFSEQLHTIWAYCQQNSEKNVSVTCIEMFYYIPDVKGDIVFTLYRSSWGH